MNKGLKAYTTADNASQEVEHLPVDRRRSDTEVGQLPAEQSVELLEQNPIPKRIATNSPAVLINTE